MSKKRGQASTEYIIIIGIVLVGIIVIFWILWHKVQVEIKEEQSADCVQALAQGANEVYSLSPGSKKYITCNVPGSVTEFTAIANEINMELSSSGDHVAFSKAQVMGNLSNYQDKGVYSIPVELLDDGVVQIGEPLLVLGPPLITYVGPQGDACNPIVLRVNTDQSTVCRYGREGEPEKTGIKTVGSSTRYYDLPHDMEGAGLSHHRSFG